MRHLLTLAIATSLLSGVPCLAVAQSPVPENPTNAPIPSGGKLVKEQAQETISQDKDIGNLPGVDFSGPSPDREIEGPGGLENGVGAVGMSVPSQSSSNPIPVETPQEEDAGIPIGAPADQ